MGKWVGAFITEDGTEFTPARQDGVWQIGNDEYHQKVFGEFVDALRERGDMPPPPGLLSRQAFKEIRAKLEKDLEILAVFIHENLDLDEPPAVAAAVQRYLDGEDTDDLDDLDDEEDMQEPVVPTRPPVLTRPLNE